VLSLPDKELSPILRSTPEVVAMRFREQFDSDQWRTLQFAPFLILSGVSGRYRDFDPKELAVFERWLDAAARAPGSLNREVLTSVSVDIDAIAAQYEGYAGTISSGLNAVGEVLVGQPVPEINGFRHALINILGAGVARARGPYGQEPTTEASQMLTMLDEFLRPGINFAPDPVSHTAEGHLQR
jgi:hypothetical protein